MNFLTGNPLPVIKNLDWVGEVRGYSFGFNWFQGSCIDILSKKN